MAEVTIRDVAREARVSVGTVSMALNNKKSVSSATRKRVEAAASRLGYRPNKYARLLNSKYTRQIGLCITDITNPFFGIIIDKVQEGLAKRGYEIILGITKGSATKECQLINNFIDMQVDGVLVVPSHKQAPDTAHLQNLRQRGIPFCFITSYYTDVAAPCVMTDLSHGSQQLTRYLLDNGHRNIVYIVANRAIPVSNLRVEGYLNAFLQTGLPFQQDWIDVSEPTFQGGYDATLQLLKTHRPDAILAMNDIMAMGVLKALKDSGIRVPEDISVAGYDDLLYASLIETPLTTVRQPMDQMCEKAVEILLAKIENPDEVCEKLLLRPEIVIRSSTRPKKCYI